MNALDRPSLPSPRLVRNSRTLSECHQPVAARSIIPATLPFARVTRDTRITLLPPPPAVAGVSLELTEPAVTESAELPTVPSPSHGSGLVLAGQDEALAALREVCVLPFTQPGLYAALRVPQPTGASKAGQRGRGACF